MSFITLPTAGVGGIVEDLKALVEKAKPLYEKIRPAVSSAYQSYKGGDATETVLPASAPPQESPAPDPSNRSGGGGMDSNLMLYAGIGAAVLAIFYFRSK